MKDDGTSRITMNSVDEHGRPTEDATGHILYTVDDENKHWLDGILAKPQGQGLGNILMWTLAEKAAQSPQQGNVKIMGLNHPGEDVRRWYESLGFLPAPGPMNQIADMAGDRVGVDITIEEAKKFATGFPMIASIRRVMEETSNKWNRQWDVTEISNKPIQPKPRDGLGERLDNTEERLHQAVDYEHLREGARAPSTQHTASAQHTTHLASGAPPTSHAVPTAPPHAVPPPAPPPRTAPPPRRGPHP